MFSRIRLSGKRVQLSNVLKSLVYHCSTDGKQVNQALSKSQLKKLAKQAKKEEIKRLKQLNQMNKEGKNDRASLPRANGINKKKQNWENEHVSVLSFDENGMKSSLSQSLTSHYDSKMVESLWDEWWEKNGFYKGLNIDQEKEMVADINITKRRNWNGNKFVMMIPPPNVTGSLHLGHALMCTIEDCIIRYWRMKGYNCLWLPGTDHAGIATQTVVERRLMKNEKKSRFDYGRNEFLNKVWEWKQQYGDKICNQIRKLGCSVDWSRQVFTMDDKLSLAVNEAFVRMFENGLIYRDNRLCHWSCSLESAISNAEVDTIEIKKPTYLEVPGYDDKKMLFGILDYFRYPIAHSDENEFLTIATTRLETMLGDTAVAVHPNDERYKKYHNKYVYHPFLKKKLPIICDSELVNMEFGTGVVKVTPAHDENDFNCGKRNNLQFINIFTNDGKINDSVLPHGKEFYNLKRFDCRQLIREKLKSLNLYVEQKPNEMAIGICSRSNDIIEPMLKPQWYVNCDSMAQKALDVVNNGQLKITPEKEGTQEWKNFLENIRPWCISRQLWWGHRIPAWLIAVNGEKLDCCEISHWIVARNENDAKKLLDNKLTELNIDASKNNVTLLQDDDVLDTWFSSGLFPFSTLGWPDESSVDLKSFFPGDLLETGSDILFFWVARMVMMSLELMDGQLPFKHVFLHPMVRDKYGKKMSKTKGNVIDPLHIIDGVSLETLIDELKVGNIKECEIGKYRKMKKQDYPNGIPPCGADALRFGLLAYLQQGRSINLDVQRVVGYRQFCNKIWNATKFSIQHFENNKFEYNGKMVESTKNLSNKWILSRLSDCIYLCNKHNSIYDFAVSTQTVHQFFLNDFCNTYLELIKPIIYCDSNDENDKHLLQETLNCLYLCLDSSFRLLHPFMPFLSEELWQRLQLYNEISKRNEIQSLMVESFPNEDNFTKYKNQDAENDMILIRDIASCILSSKQSIFNLPTTQSYPVIIRVTNETVCQKLEQYTREICRLSNLNIDQTAIASHNNASNNESNNRQENDNEWHCIQATTNHPVYKDNVFISIESKVLKQC